MIEAAETRPLFAIDDVVRIGETDAIAEVMDFHGICDGEWHYRLCLLAVTEELPEIFISVQPESKLSPAVPDFPC